MGAVDEGPLEEDEDDEELPPTVQEIQKAKSNWCTE